MKKILFLSAMAISLDHTCAQAQEPALLKMAEAAVKQMFTSKNAANTVNTKASEASKIMRPSKASFYDKNASEWKLNKNVEYTYNNSGYETQAISTDTEGTKTMTQTKYDDIYKNIATEVSQSTYGVTTATWSTPLVTMSRNLIKDEKKRVTNDKLYLLDEDGKTNELYANTVYVYGDDDRASSLTATVDMGSDGEKLLVPVTLSNMVWDAYDTSKFFIFDQDYDDGGLLTNKDFRLKSCNISMTAYNVTISGSINITYNGSESEMTMQLNYLGTTGMKSTLKMTQTDDNGSYTLSGTSTSYGETETFSNTVTFNQYGDKTSFIYESTESEGTSESSDYTAEKYEYEYDILEDGTALKKSVVESYTNSAAEALKESEKTVYEDYIDCNKESTNISYVPFDNNRSAFDSVYTLDGTKVGQTHANLPAGFYIANKAGKTIKFAKNK